MSLAGRTIAVTRGEKRDDPLTLRLRELGARVMEVPSIAFAPPASFEALDAALRELPDFAWAVFASANAVERTLARASDLGVALDAWRGVRLAAVGPGTAERLESALRTPDLVPAEARGVALARELAPHVAGRRVLVPRPEEGRPELMEGLVAAGASVSAPVAYRTVPVEKDALQPLAEALSRGEIDVVTFASPSAVRSVVAGLGPNAPAMLGKALLAAIGPTTATALTQAGLAAAVQPAAFTVPALVEAIHARLGAAPRA